MSLASYRAAPPRVMCFGCVTVIAEPGLLCQRPQVTRKVYHRMVGRGKRAEMAWRTTHL